MDIYDENRALVPRLTTARLVLRSLDASDGPAVIDALNHWDVTRWLTNVPFPYSSSDFNWFLTEFIPRERHIVWAIDAGHGLIGLVSVDSELGYWLAPDHHGQGLMTEAATAARDWHFAQRHDDLTSGYFLGNAASAKVLAKLGFRDSQIDRNVQTVRGDRVDVQRVVLRYQDWQARNG